MVKQLTTIAINKSTRDQLKLLGQKGDSYDRVLSELVSLAKQHYLYERQLRILKKERFVPLEEV